MIKELKESVAKPIIFFGNFNKILHVSERDGANRRRESQMIRFKEAVDGCGLQDLGMIDDTFNWQRGKARES